jgi:ABC-type sugar transport system ATPase subunit
MGTFNTLSGYLQNNTFVGKDLNTSPWSLLKSQSEKIIENTACLAGFRPEDAELITTETPISTALHTLPNSLLTGSVSRLERHGSETLVTVDLTNSQQSIIVRTSPHNAVSIGDAVQVSIAPEALRLFAI